MFEAKPPTALHAQHCAPQTFSDEELVAFSWDDLIARLSAAQDLRAALAHVPDMARASFDSLAAQHLANRRAFALPGSKPDVNLVASGNGKEGGAKDGAWADSARPSVRGIA